VAPGIAQHLDHQIRAAIDDACLLGEVRQRVDEAAELDAAQDAVEVAIERRLRLRQDVEAAEPRRRDPVLDADGAAELADIALLALPLADLAGDEELAAAAHERHVIGERRPRLGQRDLQLGETGIDPSGHRDGTLLRWVIRRRG
jgi:hypothetical protein